MEYTFARYDATAERFGIHDMRIDKIDNEADWVRFHFSDGIKMIEAGELFQTGKGYIEFGGCCEDDFSCYVFKRSTSRDGAKLKGRHISLRELGKLLEKKREIEIYMNLYDFAFLHWRGVLLPYKKFGLSDEVVIEICGHFPMKFVFESVLKSV